MRKLLVGMLAVALLLASTLLVLVLPWRCSVSRANFERIKEGMTRAEVEAILGGPPGVYRTCSRGTAPERYTLVGGYSWGQTYSVWSGDEVTVYVCFDRDGLVGWIDCDEAARDDTGLINLLGWRLGRLKERWLE
jgi:hypothetical protein